VRGNPSARSALRWSRCNVFVLDAKDATGMALHGEYTPCDWEHNQFAAEHQLDRLIKHGGHPWLVTDPRAADVVLMTGHGFARWCVASTILRNRALEEKRTWNKNELSGGAQRRVDGGELCPNATHEPCGPPHAQACHRSGRLFRSEQAKRRLWEAMQVAADGLNTSAPRVVVYLNNECPPAWGPGIGPSNAPAAKALLSKALVTPRGRPPARAAPRRVRPRTLLLVDRARRPQDGTVPFVLSRPAWLLGEGDVPSELVPREPWHARTLVLFAGHVPNLYISRTRYLLWRAWRRDPRVSIHTKDIACALKAFSICRQPERLEAEYQTFCHADCRTSRTCKGSPVAARRDCRAYRDVDWDAELPDVPRTNRQLERQAYLKAAMSHRFCIVAPGDFPSTPKITEFVAIGALGGW
jgi:hypothetical protein